MNRLPQRLPVLAVLLLAACGRHEPPGEITEVEMPPAEVAKRAEQQDAALKKLVTGGDKQILFGDLHVHTTYSFDAFFMSLPMMLGEGSHPPADACDFARYCSGLDFWSINDHAEGLTPEHWQETVETIRRCNEVAGDPNNPDLVSFLGWEWTQVGMVPDQHYGHKNVILRDLDEVPARPIGARGFTNRAMRENGPQPGQMAQLTLAGRDRRYQDFAKYVHESGAVPDCPEGVPVRELPAHCRELTATPEELFRKLDEWGFESLVIPHGTTWGFYTPAGSTWDKQLAGNQHDPDRQRLIEVFSGHGNSEEFRDYVSVTYDEQGRPVCPEPTPDHLPSCWRAGEIIRNRCATAGLPDDVCELRASEARLHYLEAGMQGHLTVPGADVHDWLDSGQCRDCFLPAFNYRPGGSAQYITALGNFDAPGAPKRFRFGFLASSDNHTARPGTGYKEFDRRGMTEAVGPIDSYWRDILRGERPKPEARSRPFDLDSSEFSALSLVEAERQASFFLTGGLVAVHSEGRSRNAVWDALQRREVYGTSGERMLLWFDLLNGPNPAGGYTVLPMGSETSLDRPPHFQVRAVGSPVQLDGCPDYTVSTLSPERLEHLCRGECYNPSERRNVIDRIEIVRIRPQQRAGEPVAPLIEDPWRVLPCRPDAAGCTVAFYDPEFVRDGRDTVYYARAIQQESYTINADNLRCKYDERGRCISIDPCHGDFRTGANDDCHRLSEERAWSSPIFVDAPR